jgi:hypothetical protein
MVAAKRSLTALGAPRGAEPSAAPMMGSQGHREGAAGEGRAGRVSVPGLDPFARLLRDQRRATTVQACPSSRICLYRP